MMKGIHAAGASRVLETLVGEGDSWPSRAVRLVARFWGPLFWCFVVLVVWLPDGVTQTELHMVWWMVIYAVYQLGLETFYNTRARRVYDTTSFRLFRIYFNLAMVALLLCAAPAGSSSYLWLSLMIPLLAAIAYFDFSRCLTVYAEVCIAMVFVLLVRGDRVSLPALAAMVARDGILGALAAVLYYLIHLSPRQREASALLQASTTLMQVLDRMQIAQLLADAAKKGAPSAQAAVVHLLSRNDSRTLVPVGSSYVDISTLGKSPMEIGVGIAGHALGNRETINVPDVDKDRRYHPLPTTVVPFRSLLVAPMYVGGMNIGTISVHSSEKGAFGKRDVRFLTMLAAQGAVATANAELYTSRARRRQQLSDILEASLRFGLDQQLDALLETIAKEICRCSGYRMAVVNLIDEMTGEIVVRAMSGVPLAGRRRLDTMRMPHELLVSLLTEEFRVSRSYFVRHDRRPGISDLDRYVFTPDLGERDAGEWHRDDLLFVPIQTREEKLLGYVTVDDPLDQRLPSLDTIQALEILASVAATAIENARLHEQAQQEIAERKQAETALAEQQHLLQTFMDNIPDPIYFKDHESRFVRVNAAQAGRFGLDDPVDAVSKTDFDFFTEEHARPACEDEQTVMHTGKPINKEERETWPDGRETWVLTTKMPLRDKEGKIIGTFGISTDITEKKRQEARLKEALSTVTASLAQHTSLEGCHQFIVEAGARLLSARHCSLFLLGEEGDTLEYVAAAGQPLHSGSSRIAIGTGNGCGLVAHVAETCRPVRLAGDEISQHPAWNGETWTRLGWDFDPAAGRSLLAAPMSLPDGTITGVLVARDADNVEGFSEYDGQLLETLAASAVAGIERVRSEEEAREKAVRSERKRLETDLHEAMNVLATGARWEGEILFDALSRDDAAGAHAALGRLRAALDRGYSDLRHLLEDLRDPTLEQEGLLAALRRRAELIGHGHVTVEGNLDQRLPPPIEGMLYRVGQEAMSNALKHSGAVGNPGVRVNVRLERGNGKVRLCVADNGVGFDVQATLALSHRWGLRRLRDMLHEMGGDLDIISRPDEGTRICATVDWARRDDV